MSASLLVELLTEELPPQSLRQLGQAFADEIGNGLIQQQLKLPDPEWMPFATPRRIAVLVPGVKDKGQDRSAEISGPSIKAPPEAVAGFAKKQGVKVSDLVQHETPRGTVWMARVKLKGAVLDAVLPDLIQAAIRKLPVAKLMRWGAGEAQFVRPVHGLVMMHGKRVIKGSVLGVASSNRTRGHRFMGTPSIRIALADQYESQLAKKGMVIADFDRRRSEIKHQLKAQARKHQSSLGSYHGVLDEVTALVEHPTVYVGAFDRAFLEVPQECLVLTMRQNQKYFPLFDATGKLQPRFLIVSNMKLADPRHIVGGNERVVRPRLEDARFFFNQDRKTRLDERVPQLAKVVYHNRLGSQLDRTKRVTELAVKIAGQLSADIAQTRRAAELAKADLLTGMVGEFPELQGVMGRYYAMHDGEPTPVAEAIEQHYRPRFAGDRLPEGPVACAVALADKFDAMAGLFSVGQQPTGDKDPFGLRRAALGAIRILVENRLHLSLFELAKASCEPFKNQASVELMQFIYDRFSGYLKEQGFSTLQIDAVLSKAPVNLGVVPQQLEAVKAFESLPEAESLAAANKRVANILKQAEAKGEKFETAELNDLTDPAERALHEAIHATSAMAKPLYERGDYTGYLKSFSVLKVPVDTFFDKVMVMVDDEKLRHGRLALLRDLREAMNRVADLSRLAK
jgi:glycyl-tRNA synthetase beta chain